MNKYYNAKISNLDSRDFIYEDFKKIKKNYLPKIIDYRNELLPVRNQGDQGTCYAQAAACMKEWQEKKDYELNEYLSPQFFYNNRDYMNDDNLSNDGDNGMTGRDVMKILKNIGICKENEYRYDNINRNDNYKSIPESIKINALKHRIKSYAKVTTINGLKDDLFLNGPCLIAFPVYGKQNNDINNPMWIKNTENDKFMGGHAMTVVGYNDDNKYFIIRNSWGENWGDKGYCYYKYEDWGSHWECWTTIDMDTVINDDSSISDLSDESYINDQISCKINSGLYNVYIDQNKLEDVFLMSYYFSFTLNNNIFEWDNDKYINLQNLNDYIIVYNIQNGYELINTSNEILRIYPNNDYILNNSIKCPCIIL